MCVCEWGGGGARALVCVRVVVAVSFFSSFFIKRQRFVFFQTSNASYKHTQMSMFTIIHTQTVECVV